MENKHNLFEITGSIVPGLMGRNVLSLKSLQQLRLEEVIDSILHEHCDSEHIVVNDDIEEEFKNIMISSLFVNRYYGWGIANGSFDVAKTPHELTEAMKFRSKIFAGVDYFRESIVEEIKGLNYDQYDKSSVIIISNEGNNLVSSSRIIFDSGLGFPSDLYTDSITDRDSMAEISRLVIDPSKRGSKMFLDIFAVMYNFALNNSLEKYVFSVVNDDVNMYLKFGGIEVLDSDISYGDVPKPVSVLEWRVDHTNNRYKKLFGKSIEGTLN